MKKFRVLLRGENFLLNSEGVVKRFGFYTTAFVVSPNGDEAEKMAVELIRKDQRLQEAVLNDKSDPPMLFAEEIEEVDSFGEFEDKKNRSLGFAFYDDESSAH